MMCSALATEEGPSLCFRFSFSLWLAIFRSLWMLALLLILLPQLFVIILKNLSLLLIFFTRALKMRLVSKQFLFQRLNAAVVSIVSRVWTMRQVRRLWTAMCWEHIIGRTRGDVFPLPARVEERARAIDSV